ncbi:MAG: hypothetical protein U0270_23075 [Labilithrix sp.]
MTRWRGAGGEGPLKRQLSLGLEAAKDGREAGVHCASGAAVASEGGSRARDVAGSAGVPSLREEALEQIVKAALLAQRSNLDEKAAKHFQVVHFTIQTDHLHLIVEAPDKRGLARGMTGLEVRIARRIHALLQRKGRFRAERYHRRDLRTPTEPRNVLRYVLMNVHKHSRVIGDHAFADPLSSAATVDGYSRPPAAFRDALPWPRVAPRTRRMRSGVSLLVLPTRA